MIKLESSNNKNFDTYLFVIFEILLGLENVQASIEFD